MDFGILTVFLGGVATVFTPCILPVLPVYLGMFAGSSAVSESRKFNLFFQTLLFGAGFSILFIIMGLGAATISSFFVSNKSIIALIGAIFIILMGLLFSGVIKIDLLLREYRLNETSLIKKSGYLASFFTGIVFAAGWSPCAGPVLGSVLTYVALRSTGLISGALMMSVYSIGILTPFLIFSLFADNLLPKIRRFYRFMPVFQKFGGILLVLGGLLIIYSEIPYIKAKISSADTVVLKSDYRADRSPQMLFIFSKHCPECKKLHALMPAIRDDCSGMKINISEVFIEEEPSIKERYGISTFPTIILFDSAGREVKRVFGSQNINSLRIAAASILNDRCAGEEPDIEKIKSTDMTCQGENRCEENRFQ